MDGETKRKRIGEAEATSRTVFGIKLPPVGQEAPAKWKLVEAYIDPVSNTEIQVQQPVVKSTELLTMSQSRA